MKLIQLTIYKDDTNSEVEIVKCFDNILDIKEEIIELLSYKISFSVDYVEE